MKHPTADVVIQIVISWLSARGASGDRDVWERHNYPEERRTVWHHLQLHQREPELQPQVGFSFYSGEIDIRIWRAEFCFCVLVLVISEQDASRKLQVVFLLSKKHKPLFQVLIGGRLAPTVMEGMHVIHPLMHDDSSFDRRNLTSPSHRTSCPVPAVTNSPPRFLFRPSVSPTRAPTAATPSMREVAVLQSCS